MIHFPCAKQSPWDKTALSSYGKLIDQSWDSTTSFNKMIFTCHFTCSEDTQLHE